MLTNIHRLYFVSGKGGVGKTLFAKSFARYLATDHSLKVKLLNLGKQKLEGSPATQAQHSIETLDLYLTVREYIEKKLGSDLIAKWITESIFFRSLVNMIPGMSYMLYLGKILQMLKDDPKLHIVLDAPATGHLITLLESTHTFAKIFKNGLLFKDTQMILDFLNRPGMSKILILSLPTAMSLNEAKELQDKLKEDHHPPAEIIINNSLYEWKRRYPDAQLSDEIEHIIDNERKVLTNFDSSLKIPFYSNQDHLQDDLVNWLRAQKLQERAHEASL